MNVKAAQDFLSKAEGRVGILFHDDADGTCSAALLLAYFAKKGVETVPVAIRKSDAADISYFIEKKFDYFIIVDLSTDEFFGQLELLKNRRVLIVDHHPVLLDLNERGFVFINPRLERPDVYVCASHVVYDLLNRPKELEWLMRVGAVGDREFEGNDEENEASDMVAAVKAVRDAPALEKLAVFLSKCGKLDNFLYSEKYQKLKKTFEREIDRQIAKYEVETSGNVTFFEVRSRYGISGILSTKLFDLYPKRTIFLYRKQGRMWGVSGRSHNCNVGALMKKAAEGIGTAGGHPVAGGAYVSDFKLFKKRLLELMK